MNGGCFREMLFCGKENEGKRTCYNGVYINLYDRLQYGLDWSLIQNRPPHRLRLVRV